MHDLRRRPPRPQPTNLLTRTRRRASATDESRPQKQRTRQGRQPRSSIPAANGTSPVAWQPLEALIAAGAQLQEVRLTLGARAGASPEPKGGGPPQTVPLRDPERLSRSRGFGFVGDDRERRCVLADAPISGRSQAPIPPRHGQTGPVLVVVPSVVNRNGMLAAADLAKVKLTVKITTGPSFSVGRGPSWNRTRRPARKSQRAQPLASR